MPNDLVADPVFQLNSLLWLTQALPPMEAGIRPVLRPVLREAGFEVDAISPSVTPPDILLLLKESGLAHQDSARPDVILCRSRDRSYSVVECKGNSFGPASTNARQARTLLAASGPRLNEALGLQAGTVSRSVVAYLVPSQAGPKMAECLPALSEELRGGRLQPGASCVLALEASATELSLVADGPAREFYGLSLARTPFIQLEEGTDPRPLYFIPYDPDCDQSEEERAYCKRVLYERIQASILGACGRATPPMDFEFRAADLLNDATMGMYDCWENRDSTRHMRKLVRDLLAKFAEVLRPEVGNVFRFVEHKGWTLQMSNESTKNAIFIALSKFSCETLDLRREPEPTLFDDLDD